MKYLIAFIITYVILLIAYTTFKAYLERYNKYKLGKALKDTDSKPNSWFGKD
jgi:hypothetical protein